MTMTLINGNRNILLAMAALAKLKGLLEDSDSEAGDLLSELLDKLGNSTLATQLKPVATAIEGFDFDEALDQLKSITAL